MTMKRIHKNELKIDRQKVKLQVNNHDLLFRKNQQTKHSVLLPNTVRCIITGPSNCGKTNVIITLLEHENGLKFENVYVYSKSLNQDKYVYLRDILLGPIKGISCFHYDNSEDILEPSKANQNSVFIFDDVACSKQNIIREYFCMGRHNSVDCFYLHQSYAKISKHLIRDNANALIVFKVDDLNLKHIYMDHVSADMTFPKFKYICSLCWKHPYGFLSIFKDFDVNKGGYRIGFHDFINPDTISDKMINSIENKSV